MTKRKKLTEDPTWRHYASSRKCRNRQNSTEHPWRPSAAARKRRRRRRNPTEEDPTWYPSSSSSSSSSSPPSSSSPSSPSPPSASSSAAASSSSAPQDAPQDFSSSSAPQDSSSSPQDSLPLAPPLGFEDVTRIYGPDVLMHVKPLRIAKPSESSFQLSILRRVRLIQGLIRHPPLWGWVTQLRDDLLYERNAAMLDSHSGLCIPDLRDFCAICALRDIIKASLRTPRHPVKPTRIVDNLNFFSPHFTKDEQADSHEFMTFVFEKIEACFPVGVPNPVGSVFGGKLNSKVSRVNEAAVMEAKAYLLFYAQSGMPWFVSSVNEPKLVDANASAKDHNPENVVDDVSVDAYNENAAKDDSEERVDGDHMDARNENAATDNTERKAFALMLMLWTPLKDIFVNVMKK
ncbi:hypothetical protein PIB30_072528 [Stylosanthes scabra]|uniref:Peptidase C19 ubiquitin carboxyl-terminal hydrolase domain-containing protein n=1 Tax=Stylosanthes scabra TaxID=79078 RepID=A0ABU6XP34_9FABA|nr:hypothetical protein [Stylosanthes scabra]